MSDGDTDDLLLRDIEAAVVRARIAYDAKQLDELVVSLADIQWQALRLIEILQSRIAGRETQPPESFFG